MPRHSWHEDQSSTLMAISQKRLPLNRIKYANFLLMMWNRTCILRFRNLNNWKQLAMRVWSPCLSAPQERLGTHQSDVCRHCVYMYKRVSKNYCVVTGYAIYEGSLSMMMMIICLYSIVYILYVVRTYIAWCFVDLYWCGQHSFRSLLTISIYLWYIGKLGSNFNSNIFHKN